MKPRVNKRAKACDIPTRVKALVNSIRENTKDYLKKYYGDNWKEEDLFYRKEHF